MISIVNVPKVKAVNSYTLTMEELETLISIDNGKEIEEIMLYKYMANGVPAYAITDNVRRRGNSKYSLP